ncbi:MAG TPA: carboxypeptidase-like regulatory domain-containing protein, partial [Acidisarcina sp.]
MNFRPIFHSFSRLPAVAVIFMVGVLLSVSPLYAQQTLGSILGTVTDASGSSLAGAQVTLLDQGTGLQRTTVSSQAGAYAFYNLAIGTYTVSVTSAGFAESRFPNILVQGDRTVTLNARLTIGSVQTAVTVEASPLLNAVDTTNGYILDSAQIENVPLATGSFTQLAVLAPGVSAELLSGTGTQTALGNQPIWANGQRDTSNTFLFNGVDVSNLFNGKSTSQVSSGRVVPNTGEGFGPGGSILTGTSVYDAIGQAIPTPAPESIEEIRVNTSMYDAQQGSTSGAHIDMSTKAGTNVIHGQAYLYRGTDWLNAAPFFYKDDPAIPANKKVPELHRFTTGASVGAPIIKDKLFGFLAYNAIRVTDQASGISNLAVTPGLGSDRSAQALVNLVQTNFGQTITASQIDPAALTLFNFKLPNGAYLIPSAQSPALTNESNVTLFGRPSFTADQAVADLDWNATPKDVVSAKYFYQHDPTIAPYTNSATDGFAQHLDSG